MSIPLAAPVAVVVALGTAVTMTAVQPEARPAPPPEFTKVCVRCHASDKVVEGRRYRTQWDQVLEQMVARGATGSDEEFGVIFDYLVAEFGRVAINTAPGDEIAQVLHLDAGVADTIVQHRTKAGPFADFAALIAVPGVPVAALEQRRDAIVF